MPLKRTISVMLGKGSVNHNSRKFKAENIDTERTSQNITYCNKPIKQVYRWTTPPCVNAGNVMTENAGEK